VATIEVSRTLVKSPPELWAELEGDRLSQAVGKVTVRPTEHERKLAWEAAGARGTALLEPAEWGTKVTLTAELEDAVARRGTWRPKRAADRLGAQQRADVERRLSELLDDLGSAHRKPFTRV
jgi:hypothetical protein